ncbi:MAG: hypothetical protein IIC82_10090 [Chloroflexi bacterium]|nr:hypothetical protein [Chloroflexota bacterium]
MTAALVLILVLALGLRFYGLNWDRGQAFTPHPDERAILMKVGDLSFPGLGEPDSAARRHFVVSQSEDTRGQCPAAL